MSAGLRVAGLALALAVVFGVAWAAGAAVGPVLDESEPMAHDDAAAHAHGAEADEPAADLPADRPGGLAVAQDGYRLVLADDVLPAGPQDLTFEIRGPDGAPVTAYDVEHEKLLHLIVVRRDLAGYQHLHPTLDEDTGAWTTKADVRPGSWRVFADFVPSGGEGLTLGGDLLVPGPVRAPAPVTEARVDTVDGFRVRVDGDLVAGEHSMLTFEVSRDGVPVADLEPYLGAAGHLVVLRDGDLAYLHVHPGEGLEFGAEVPSAGTYHLFLDFKHDGVVRTADLVLEAS